MYIKETIFNMLKSIKSYYRKISRVYCTRLGTLPKFADSVAGPVAHRTHQVCYEVNFKTQNY